VVGLTSSRKYINLLSIDLRLITDQLASNILQYIRYVNIKWIKKNNMMVFETNARFKQLS